MEHAEQVRLIHLLMHQLDTDTNVDAGGWLHNPTSAYLDPERAEPGASFDVTELLGELGPELDGWDLAAAERRWDTRYDTPMNWKLANDTFGETYQFDALHRDTLAPFLHGNCQAYDTYGRNHRMLLTSRGIDLLRDQPESEWHLLKATLPVYYIFPNVQLILGQGGPTLVRVYPKGADPHQSYSEISFYTHAGMQAAGRHDAMSDDFNSDQAVLGRAQGFAGVIEAEDYTAAASSHRGAMAGAQQHFVFGRNEPALHHYHQTYREALNMAPLELIPAQESTA